MWPTLEIRHADQVSPEFRCVRPAWARTYALDPIRAGFLKLAFLLETSGLAFRIHDHSAPSVGQNLLVLKHHTDLLHNANRSNILQIGHLNNARELIVLHPIIHDCLRSFRAQTLPPVLLRKSPSKVYH